LRDASVTEQLGTRDRERYMEALVLVSWDDKRR